MRVLANNTPAGMATGLAIDAMLKAVGIDDQLNITDDAGQMTQQYVIQHDFDVVVTGFATSNDEGGMVALLQNFSCGSPSNRIGFCDPALDTGLAAVRTASTDAQKVAGYTTVAKEVNARAALQGARHHRPVPGVVGQGPRDHGHVARLDHVRQGLDRALKNLQRTQAGSTAG